VKSLFQTTLYEDNATRSGIGKQRWSAAQKAKERVGDSEGQMHARQVHKGQHSERGLDQQCGGRRKWAGKCARPEGGQ
jgi:hypothetical protein